MINMGEIFAYSRLNNPDMELVPLNSDEIETYGVLEGDLLFARQSLIASGAGKCSIVLEVPEVTVFEGHLIRVRLDPAQGVPLFYYYYFNSHYGKGNIQSLVMQVAAAGIRGSELAKLSVPHPPWHEQQHIASILSAYDDLIENNTRRIALLEESMRLLYREWFVRLRFPGHEAVEVVDRLPEGWATLELDKACLSISDGDWIETKDQGGNDFRLIQISNLEIGGFKETGNYRFISRETFERLKCQEIKSGDILIARMPDPIGRAWLVTEMPWRMITAVDIAIVKVNPKIISPYYCTAFLNSSETLELSKSYSSGTTRPRITRRNICTMDILIPPRHLLKEFDDFASYTYSMIINLKNQNTQLAEARDLLLPRLMNGGIPIQE